jgi:hypothetical protein
MTESPVGSTQFPVIKAASIVGGFYRAWLVSGRQGDRDSVSLHCFCRRTRLISGSKSNWISSGFRAIAGKRVSVFSEPEINGIARQSLLGLSRTRTTGLCQMWRTFPRSMRS